MLPDFGHSCFNILVIVPLEEPVSCQINLKTSKICITKKMLT